MPRPAVMQETSNGAARVFSLAYVILPFSDTPPADAIRASLARFQKAGLGELPNDWLDFDDQTAQVRSVHEARITFVDRGREPLEMHGGPFSCSIDDRRVRDEMRRRGVQRWSVRFADSMDLDTFIDRFGPPFDCHPTTGGYGQWFNPLGQWDWWDLGGRYDGCIVGDPQRQEGRGVARISSGDHRGRSLLAFVEDLFVALSGQEPVAEIDVRSDLNVELVATLLADAQAGRKHAYPTVLVLPPGVAEDSRRWLESPLLSTPQTWPVETLAWLGTVPDEDWYTSWHTVVKAAYARLADHWAAGVAYHY
jgi:hypothetical protein